MSFFSRVMRTEEDHVDHDDGLNEQDDDDDDGHDDDDTTINFWRRFGGEDTRERRDELGRRWAEFSFEDEDDVGRIDDGHDGADDCGDNDGRDDDDKD